MSVRAVIFKKRVRRETRNFRSEVAAHRYAARNDYDGVEVQMPDGSVRYYFLNRHGWRGPVNEEDWLYEYMKARKDFSAQANASRGRV